MKVNRITFDKISAQWDILKMSSAYIHAERQIMDSASRGVDLTGADQNIKFTFDAMDPEDFNSWEISTGGKMEPISPADEILDKARKVREKLDNAIHDDNYVKAQLSLIHI